MLIEHRLDFRSDWLTANDSFRMHRVDATDRILPDQYTSTGHLNNHFAVGPALLWSPFLIMAHAGVLLCDRLGGHIAADGHSRPYLVAMALGTAFYGFLALWISFVLARQYVAERWAFLATVGIWFASSLPVYMYFNPSWSNAHSAFAVALFLWYWMRTRNARTWLQCVTLGALGGLMLDVYYLTAVVLLLPLLESLAGYGASLLGHSGELAWRLFLKNAAFSMTLVTAFLPTLIAKKIIYGSYFNMGYTEQWFWKSPALFKVCFSSEHGLFSWTPILLFAVTGLFVLRKYDRTLGLYLIIIFAACMYTVGCYQDWHGISSYGNRFFVGLTPLFVLGLAALFDWLARAWQERRAAILACSATAVLILWNLGLIFQWGMHLIPDRGPISWRDAAYNQVAVVPAQAAHSMRNYFLGRRQMMERIERQDVHGLHSPPASQ
jgi:MFS family permease